jgi:hypothetical protein
MHKTGMFGINKQTCNDTVVHAGITEFYDFLPQGNQAIQEPEFKLFPGDSFSTCCVFDSKEVH